MKEKNVVVIGGSNIDIAGYPIKKLIEKDSNPGNIKFSIGGVGRNIAENISLLDIKVNLITAIGNDLHGKEIQKDCSKKNIDISHILIDSDLPTSVYLFILDENNDMKIAISDMKICEKITQDFLSEKLEIINKFDVCALDTNLEEESLKFIAENIKVPIFIDCVSTTKAKKIKNILKNIHTVKCNDIEAEAVSGIKIEGSTPNNKKSLEKISEYFFSFGVQQVFITLGADGVFYATKKNNGFTPAEKVEMINASGAGDSFMGAIIYSFVNGFSIEEASKFGVVASAITIQSKNTVSENLSVKNIYKILKNKGE